MKLLRIYDSHDLETLPDGVWGIKEPGNEYDGKERQDGRALLHFLSRVHYICQYLFAVLDDDEPLDLIFLPGKHFKTTYFI